MINYKDKYIKYKNKYFNLRNQIGSGWKLFYDQENGRPYYENENGEKIWAGDPKGLGNGEYYEWNGYQPQNIISWVSEEGQEWKSEKPYYDKNTGEYYQYKSHKYTKEKKLLGSSLNYITLSNGTREKLYRSAKEIWPIDEELKKQLFPTNDSPFKFDVQITEKKDEYNYYKNSLNFQNFSEFINQNIEWSDVWLGLGKDIPINKALRNYKPNRILVHGVLGPTIDSKKENDEIRFVPILYYDKASEIDENLKKMIIDNLTKFDLEFYKHKLELFNKYITNDRPIWIKISWGYSITCSFNGSNINIELKSGKADYLIPGYVKVLTCFMIKFLKEKYPSMNINKIELEDFSLGAWVKHGFEEIDNRTDGMTLTYNFERGSTICKEVKEKFGVDEILYYDFTHVYEKN